MFKDKEDEGTPKEHLTSEGHLNDPVSSGHKNQRELTTGVV